MHRMWHAFMGKGAGMRPVWAVESLMLGASLFFALFCNRLFIQGMLAGYEPNHPAAWAYAAALVVAVAALHFFLFGLVMTRWTVKPLLIVLFIATAFAEHFMTRYRVFLDTSMLRNILATDVREAGDLMTWSLLPQLALYAVLPIALLLRVEVRQRSLLKAFGVRVLSLIAALAVFAGAIFINFQDVATSMRNTRELRFLVTPANYVYSLAQLGRSQAQAADKPRQPIGEDAQAGSSWAQRNKPVVMVMVVGETVRAANWGLSGYTRQTTPELAAFPGVINFSSVRSCGTDTETSLPCIFSPWGRRQYDESKIRGSESLLDVVARAGFRVVWVDNQAGCKGVCQGVESARPDPALSPQACAGKECQDAALVDQLRRLVKETPGNLLIVLHQMGNHGPAYFKRYPDEFKVFTPACEDPDLPHCSSESIVNAYDNAIRYADHVLASALGFLNEQTSHDAAMLYVSDHGESLGEKGLFLHGVPYAIAPDMQTQVPMVMWLSPSFAQSMRVNSACLSEVAKAPQAHDNIFHTLLGMLDVKTAVYAPEMDFSARCRGQ